MHAAVDTDKHVEALGIFFTGLKILLSLHSDEKLKQSSRGPYREDSDVTNAVAEQGLHMHLAARWAPKSCQCCVFAALLGWVLHPLPLQLLSPSAADGIEQIERQKDSSDNTLTVPALNKHTTNFHPTAWLDRPKDTARTAISVYIDTYIYINICIYK